ncbi:orotate phosphoribosyltransferase [Halorhodospira halophila]|uniref:Orotate phosphoribosyltransferase n=1 Tax=Halorhodospira halophila (strain DSM 244 / SL1) TaxID=349124 RepID=PYRE_HALHL|nr:orotate phosphoribosyltransferase [Halorhodospira halophila]A1WZE3.1 RecName: Full=Orotate phosphoribosyltransferase; Short=OPRT; Short=OPRTase [Halorhodospira halophila SL1]ABM63055.1 orotate phosphoribosyltransferase [Halorhodospira halophila SL1]MBK1727823.1 orotate phosphoribosyltransferase [Halorhodospira halophila]
MYEYQEDFIRFALDRGVLRFGRFTLKSGRESPYFFNTGLFNSGTALSKLGRCYVESLVRAQIDFDLVFGPAYKGIPLATAVAMALAETRNRDVPYAFDRKEVKDHGEGGRLVGAPVEGRRAVIVDDVISSGISIREAAELITAEGGTVAAVAIALDRKERGRDEVSAVHEVEQTLGAPVVPIITLDHLETYLADHGGKGDTLDAIRQYRARYGAA